MYSISVLIVLIGCIGLPIYFCIDGTDTNIIFKSILLLIFVISGIIAFATEPRDDYTNLIPF
jgi:hypothetical protein